MKDTIKPTITSNNKGIITKNLYKKITIYEGYSICRNTNNENKQDVYFFFNSRSVLYNIATVFAI